MGASEWMYCLTRAAPVSTAECVSSAPACVASVTSTPALAWLLRHHGCGRLHQECEHYTSWPVPAGTSVFALHRSVCGTQLRAGEHQCNPSGGCSATWCCDLIFLGPRYRLGAPLTRMSVSLAPEMSNIVRHTVRLTVCKTPDTTYLLYMGSQPTECMGNQDGFLQGQRLYSGYIWLIRLGSTLPNMSFGFCSRVVNAVGQSNLTSACT